MIGEKPVSTLYAWIALFADGSEGLLSRDMQTPFGRRHLPLITSKLDVANHMEAVAKQIQTESVKRGLRFKIVMRTFRQELG
jgi:hypothetical protein